MAQRSLRIMSFMLSMLIPLFIFSSILGTHAATINLPALTERESHKVNSREWLTYDQWNALNIQNNYRRARNLRSMVWDPSLQRDAQRWANHLAYIDKMVHSSRRGDEGENLAWISGGGNPLSSSARMWMAESKNYWGQIIPQGNFEAYGHYTQSMWWSTSRMGMASARSRSGRIYTVARYWNPGNIIGHRPY